MEQKTKNGSVPTVKVYVGMMVLVVHNSVFEYVFKNQKLFFVLA